MDFSRKFIFALLFLFPSHCFGVEFLSWEDAVRVAKDSDSKIYLLITGENCPWCDRQKEVLAGGKVSEALSGFLVCKVDARTEVAKKYRSRIVPLNLVLDADGEVVKKNAGFMDEQKFLSWIN